MVDKKTPARLKQDKVSTKSPRTKIPQKQRRKLVFSILAMLLWVAASVIASQLIIGYLLLWIVGAETFQTPMVTTIYSALSYILAMVLIIFVPPCILAKTKAVNNKTDENNRVDNKLKLSTRKELGLTGWPTWTDIGLTFVGFVAYVVLAAGLTALFVFLSNVGIFPWFDADQTQDVGYSILNSGLDRVVAFIALVVIAPVAEEIIFRGWLYGKLRRKLSGQMSEIAGMILSIFLVSLLFGIVHLQWNVGINVFALSIVLCGLREITGTIYAGILLHMVKNGLAFYLLYVAGV